MAAPYQGQPTSHNQNETQIVAEKERVKQARANRQQVERANRRCRSIGARPNRPENGEQ